MKEGIAKLQFGAKSTEKSKNMKNKNFISNVYRESLALMTDLYELTMAYGYWKKGLADKDAVFHLFFRRKPFNGSFAIAAGLATVLDYLDNFRFQADDLAYLATLKTDDGNLLFEKKFLDYLSSFSFSCDIDAIPE